MRRSSGARALHHLVGLGRSGLRAPGRQAAPVLASRLEASVPVGRKCTRLRACSQQWRGFAQHVGAEQECVVSNAGIADYNGKYVLDPEYSTDFPGVGYRKQGSEQTLFGPIAWNGGTWGLSKNYGSFDYYVMSSADVPPSSGWLVDTEGIAGGAGLHPAPTVALSSEAEAEAEAQSSKAHSSHDAETEKAEASKAEASKADAGKAEAETRNAEASRDAETKKAKASEAEASEANAEEAEELSPVERLQQELDELQDHSRAKKKELLLALADFENNKKKFMKEREGRRRTANTNFARRMVDIYREFEDLPALNSSARKEEGSPCAALQEGVTMTRNLFATALSKSDVERLPVELGTPVVNARHEVVGCTTGDGSLTEGSIAEVIEAGWMMDLRSQTPRVLHKAKVKTVG